jgi:hypothetical protein
MIRDSKDGSCHVCIKEGLGASILPYLPLCLFGRRWPARVVAQEVEGAL